MADMIAILNTIRDNASTSYTSRVPEATKSNIEAIQSAIVGDDDVMVANEFCSVLMNKIVKAVFHHKMFSNPLKALKKGKKPLGDGIEEIYANFLKGEAYDPTGANLLNRTLPDVKVIYHRMNRQDQYPVTISRQALTKAFKSYENLETFMNGIIQSVYNSAELDEFIIMKKLLTQAITDGAVKKVKVADPSTSSANATTFVKDVKKVSNLMKFPSDQFNGYLQVQTTDTKPITTFSKLDEQVLILDTSTDVDISIDVLAAAFNMTVAEFNETRKIIIDVFPDPNIRGMLIDEAFIQIYDDFYSVTNFHNPKGLYDNYYLNVWQTIAYSPLVNAVAFTVEA